MVDWMVNQLVVSTDCLSVDNLVYYMVVGKVSDMAEV
jgi:hypothetical protein